jgi:hypothetical protein
MSVLQTDIFNVYLTQEQLQQRLTELFMPMLPSDLRKTQSLMIGVIVAEH